MTPRWHEPPKRVHGVKPAPSVHSGFLGYARSKGIRVPNNLRSAFVREDWAAEHVLGARRILRWHRPLLDAWAREGSVHPTGGLEALRDDAISDGYGLTLLGSSGAKEWWNDEYGPNPIRDGGRGEGTSALDPREGARDEAAGPHGFAGGAGDSAGGGASSGERGAAGAGLLAAERGAVAADVGGELGRARGVLPADSGGSGGVGAECACASLVSRENLPERLLGAILRAAKARAVLASSRGGWARENGLGALLVGEVIMPGRVRLGGGLRCTALMIAGGGRTRGTLTRGVVVYPEAVIWTGDDYQRARRVVVRRESLACALCGGRISGSVDEWVRECPLWT